MKPKDQIKNKYTVNQIINIMIKYKIRQNA